MMLSGSKKWSISTTDAFATVRDAVIFLASAGVSFAVDTFLPGMVDEKTQGAIVLCIYTGLKLAWKYITNTERVSII